MLTKETADELSNFTCMCLKGEMTRIKQMNLGIGKVALISLRTCGDECRIVTPPDREQRWLMIAEVGLELGIALQIATVVQDQVQLDFFCAGPRHQSNVK